MPRRAARTYGWKRRAVERLWQHCDTYHHMGPEHSHLVRDEWVDRFPVAGTPDEVREQVCKILHSDIGELTIIPFGKSKETVLKLFAEGVMNKLCEEHEEQTGDN